MSWTSTSKICAGVFAIAAAGSAIAGTIVIRADGPSKAMYPPGKALSGRVALKRGDTIVLLDGKGTRTLTGPLSVDLNATVTASAAPSAFSALIRNTGARQVRTGAVRGGVTAAPATPSLWYVDVSKAGIFCVPDTAHATLWRSAMTDPTTFILTRTSDGHSASLSFASGQSVRSWPVRDLPIAEGAEYRLTGPTLSRATSIRFVAIGDPGDTPDGVASALISKGCTTQLNMLVRAGAAAPDAG